MYYFEQESFCTHFVSIIYLNDNIVKNGRDKVTDHRYINELLEICIIFIFHTKKMKK